MTKTTVRSWGRALACCALLAVGCSPNEATLRRRPEGPAAAAAMAPAPAEPATAAAMAPAPAEPATAAAMAPAPAGPAAVLRGGPEAPLRLQLAAEEAPGGEVSLRATVEAAPAWRQAVVLRLELPPEARLLDGLTEEHLPAEELAPAASRLSPERRAPRTWSRRFRILHLGAGPARLVANAQGSGTFAEASAQYPPAAPAAVPAIPRERITPLRTPGGLVIDQMVPMGPAGEPQDRD